MRNGTLTHSTVPIKLRPNWHDIRFAMAKAIASRSLCIRDQVGAVIVDINNKIIGEGYNGPPTGFWHSNSPCNQWCQRTVNANIDPANGPQRDYSDCPALHAESNALMMSDRSLRSGGTIYVTSHICIGCAKLIANSGLHTVRVSTAILSEHRQSSASYDFLKSCGLEIYLNGECWFVTR